MSRKNKKSAIELFSRYTDIKILKSELESLGFLERVEKPTLVVMENPDLELYVQIGIIPENKVNGYDVLTFEEIEEALR